MVVVKRSEKETENIVLVHEGCLRLRWKFAKMVIKRGGNAIISYCQSIDYENDKTKRIVIRGYGTAVYLVKHDDGSNILKKPTLPKAISGGSHLHSGHVGAGKSRPFMMINEDPQQVGPSQKDKQRVQFITSSVYPADQSAIVYYGAIVSARTVRLI